MTISLISPPPQSTGGKVIISALSIIYRRVYRQAEKNGMLLVLTLMPLLPAMPALLHLARGSYYRRRYWQ